jgi:hypothetical protein
MNSIQDISAIAQLLSGQEWSWTRNGIETLVSSLGWKVLESLGHRKTYKTPEELNASIYYNHEQPESIEVGIKSFKGTDLLNELEYDDKVDEFYESYLEGTRQMTTGLGVPVFADGAAAVGFPDDQDAVWLSMWMTPTARIMLQQKHEDRELPFRICIVISPIANTED